MEINFLCEEYTNLGRMIDSFKYFSPNVEISAVS